MTVNPRAEWLRISPGAYVDARGELHLVLPEMLEENGYVDTPANREQLIAMMRRLLPAATITIEL